MRRFHSLWAVVIGVLAVTAAPSHSYSSPAEYTVTVLGALSNPMNVTGETLSIAYGVNDAGQVAGGSQTSSNGQHAVIWTGITPADSGVGGSATGINASGVASGASILPGFSEPHAIRITGTTITDLGTVDGGTYSDGLGINASGQVIGGAYNASFANVMAVVWTGTTPQILDTLGGPNTSGFAINDSGQATGYSELLNGPPHAVRWTGTAVQDLGTLGGVNSQGFGINNAGQVVGDSQITGSQNYHATLWNGTTPTDLGTLGGAQSYAYGINANGDVVGNSYLADNKTQDPFLYTGGQMYDLDNLILPGSGVTNISLGDGSLGSGSSIINGSDQIIASGTFNGNKVAILLTPTPELGSATLILFGGLGLLGRRFRARSKP